MTMDHPLVLANIKAAKRMLWRGSSATRTREARIKAGRSRKSSAEEKNG